MSRHVLISVATVALVVAAVVGLACSSGSDTKGGSPTDDASEELTQTAEAGGVTVDATWLTQADLEGTDADLSAYPLEEFAAVEIAFTTHSGDLNKIKMEDAATLQAGGSSIKPEAWISVSDDSHHREGVLIFARTNAEGAAELRLELKGGEAISLRWPSVPLTSDRSDPRGAILELAGDTFDLGDVPADETVERVVAFTNPGNEPLSVEVVKVRPAPDAACGCGVEGYEVRPGEVPPGGGGELVFKLRVPGGMADMEDVMIAELRTNDPTRLNPEIRLVFRMASEEDGG